MTAESVDDYLAAVGEPARGVLLAFRDIVHEFAPDVTETIAYGMPTFQIPGRHRFHAAAWATHVGIYPVHPAPEPLESELAPLRAAKDTVRLPLDRQLDVPLDRELARRLVAFLLERPSPVALTPSR